AGLRVLAGGGRIGDAVGNGGIRGQPPALLRLVQKPGAHVENRLSREQAAKEQVTVLSQPVPQDLPVIQVFGRIPEGFVLRHDFPPARGACARYPDERPGSPHGTPSTAWCAGS